MENLKNLQKDLQRRNFYSTKDTGKIFLYAIFVPLILGIVFAYVVYGIASQLGMPFEEGANIIDVLFEHLWFAIPFAMLTQIVFFCLYFVYNKSNRITQKACNISFKKANVWTVMICACVGILCVLGFVWLIEGCIAKGLIALGVESGGLALPCNTIGWYFVNMLLLGVVPAVCEELIFRGMIFQGLKEKFSSMVSVLVSAMLFAIMHQNVLQLVYPFILGCVFAVVMHKTNNLIYPIIIHMFNNFTSITINYILNVKGIAEFPFPITWWTVLLAILAAVATFGILYLIYRFYLKKHKKIEIEKEGYEVKSNTASFGKVPFTLVCGILFALAMIVINAIPS